MILGINASGRPNGVTADAVKAVLSATNLPSEYISLAGKRFTGCIGCTLCAADNVCKVNDDWLNIGDAMLRADAIVFGAPNYFGSINALGHACLERTFCFRHRDAYRLAGKLGLVVSTDYKGTDEVATFIQNMMTRNKMAVIDTVFVRGYSQCYTCGFGHDCASGNVVKDHGFLEEILPEHLPAKFGAQPAAITQAYKAGRILGSILAARC